MELIQHTLHWTKGEILEGTIVAISGAAILGAAFLFWKFGGTPNGKALVIPLLVVGLLLAIAGIAGVVNNNQRLQKYQDAHSANPAQFVAQEKTRVEGFETIFKVTYPLFAVFIAAGVLLFLFLGGPNINAIGLVLILLGLAGYTIDHFAKERGEIYYREILKVSNESAPDTLT